MWGLAYWYDMYVEEGEEIRTTTVGPLSPAVLSIVGVGFQERFNPQASSQMKCELNGKRPVSRVCGCGCGWGWVLVDECRVHPASCVGKHLVHSAKLAWVVFLVRTNNGATCLLMRRRQEQEDGFRHGCPSPELLRRPVSGSWLPQRQ